MNKVFGFLCAVVVLVQSTTVEGSFIIHHKVMQLCRLACGFTSIGVGLSAGIDSSKSLYCQTIQDTKQRNSFCAQALGKTGLALAMDYFATPAFVFEYSTTRLFTASSFTRWPIVVGMIIGWAAVRSKKIGINKMETLMPDGKVSNWMRKIIPAQRRSPRFH